MYPPSCHYGLAVGPSVLGCSISLEDVLEAAGGGLRTGMDYNEQVRMHCITPS